MLEHHTDLLTDAEVARLQSFSSLSVDAQCLLARLIMRVPVHFVVNELRYAELLAPVSQVVDELVQEGWLQANPCVSVEVLPALLRREQLSRVMTLWLPDSAWSARGRKRDWQEALLAARRGETRPWREWWGDASLDIVAVPPEVTQLWQRVRLMFFGNLRQDWSELVLTELGYQRYEPVEFSPGARAFQCRSEVDAYLQLVEVRDRLAEQEDWLEAWRSLPETGENTWLRGRRARVLEDIGRAAEKARDARAALAAFDASGTPASRIRAWRLREQLQPASRLFAQLQMALQHGTLAPLERQACERIAQRLRRRLEGASIRRPSNPWPVEHLRLPATGHRVEACVATALTADGSHCRHVENTLHTGLFAMLCWPALYAAVPGAFFHPFQRGPADLLRESFPETRRETLERCLAALKDDSWRTKLRTIWQSRHGVANSMMAWGAWDETLLEGVLHCMPAQHVELLIRHLLRDLRAHRSGMPDLFRWWPNTARYEWIEVKGPGDRLQDHQRLWLDFLHRHRMPVRVVHVQWENA